MNFHLTTPVLIIAFNRPDLTQAVFDEVRKARPPQLFFAANHPETPEDRAKSEKVRAILKQVDWDCQVRTFYPPSNTGHTWGPINAITWAFKHSPELIVLEDDCVPNQSFFRYCQELLAYYRDDERVFSIGGAVYLDPMPKLRYSYWFSPLTSTWGWASWRRSWEKLDFTLSMWPKLRDTDWLMQRIGNPYIAADYHKGIDKAYRTRYTKDFVGWDYIYNFTMLLQGGVDARPAANLVSNIGFRPDASHTKEKTVFSDFPTRELEFPLKHPPVIKTSIKFEEQFYRQADPKYSLTRFHLRRFKKNLNWANRQVQKISAAARRIYKIAGLEHEYKFRLSDYFKYIFEPFGHRKITVKDIATDGIFDQLQINEFKFFWPHGQARKELTALWQEVFNPRLLNPHSYDFPEGQIQKGWTVIDAGAAEGFFTHYALAKQAKVIAFEPVSILAGCLKKTFAQAIGGGKVTIVQAILGKFNGESSIRVNAEMLSMSAEGQGEGSEKCAMVTLDQWTRDNNIGKVDFIKMDIEGAEIVAIPGARGLIARDKPRLAIAVYHDKDNGKILKELLLSFRPDYRIKFGGIFDYDGVRPRPYMLYAY